MWAFIISFNKYYGKVLKIIINCDIGLQSLLKKVNFSYNSNKWSFIELMIDFREKN